MDVDDGVRGEQRLGDERTEGADDDDVRRGGGDLRSSLLAVDRFGLAERETELTRDLGDRRRGELASPAGRVTTSTGRCALPARRARIPAANAVVPR